MTNIVPETEINDSDFVDDYEEQFDELKQHMFNYDFDAYMVQQKHLMEIAIEWNQLYAETECKRLMEQKNQKNRAITAGFESEILCPKH